LLYFSLFEAAGPYILDRSRKECDIPTFALATTDVIVHNPGCFEGKIEFQAGISLPEVNSIGAGQTLTFTRFFGGVLLCVTNKGDTTLIVTTR